MVNSRNLQSIQEENDNLQHIKGRGNKESEEGERQEVEEIGEEETGDNMKDSANNVTGSSSLPTAIKNHPGIDLIVDLNDNLMETYCIQDKEGDVENDFIHKEEEEVRRDQEEEEENQEKLKNLEKRISKWYREEIGNVHKIAEEWEATIDFLKKMNLIANTEKSREELNKDHTEYVCWLNKQESILK
ncbi:hypothetical protein K7X08_022464 [Anisodus acutangulus]|uniref:Uncharacterized protein n=1 Tax=Anisodus acutangulus TaxID=402998 RepID=A0A9Q1MLM2_9SOLA|nr:hypothetical protein K7X08_022464 [Anisodus acutangulus]